MANNKIYILKVPGVIARSILFGEKTGCYLLDWVTDTPGISKKKVYICSADSSSILGHCTVGFQGRRKLSSIVAEGKKIDPRDALIQGNLSYNSIKPLSQYTGTIAPKVFGVTRLIEATPFSRLLSYETIKETTGEVADEIARGRSLMVFEGNQRLEALMNVWCEEYDINSSKGQSQHSRQVLQPSPSGPRRK